MRKLKGLRLKIDQIDQRIMSALDKRFKIAQEIGALKLQEKQKIANLSRENEILSKAANWENEDAIKSIYQSIFNESKLLQFTSCLVGKSLPYTYSKIIHTAYNNRQYQIIECDDFDQFMQDNCFSGLNITNPFKRLAINYADILSDTVQATKIINHLERKNGLIYGDNTDYDAFIQMCQFYHLHFTNKEVLIIGNGATAQTIACAIEKDKPRIITKLVRTIRGENEDLIENYHHYSHYEIIINTTNYGVHPNLETNYLFSFDYFSHAQAFIDVNYNPWRSSFILAANRLKKTRPQIKVINGLMMLVYGGKRSEELWQDKQLHYPHPQDLAKSIFTNHFNIALIGMPYAGKTTIGKALSQKLNLKFIDSDEVLSSRNQGIEAFLLDEDFPERFRAAENAFVQELLNLNLHLFALGGGMIEHKNNLLLLSQVSIIIFIDTPLATLLGRIDKTRPLADTREKLIELYHKRLPLYQANADLTFNPENETVLEMVGKINEFINNQWS